MERKEIFPYTIKSRDQELYLKSVVVYHEGSLLFSVEYDEPLGKYGVAFGKVKFKVDTRKGGDYPFVRKPDLHFAYGSKDGPDTGISCSSVGIEAILIRFTESALEIIVKQKEEFPKLGYQTDYRRVGVI